MQTYWYKIYEGGVVNPSSTYGLDTNMPDRQVIEQLTNIYGDRLYKIYKFNSNGHNISLYHKREI